MPLGATAGTMLAIGTTAGTAAAGVYGAHRQSQAAERSAQLTTRSADRGAMLQAQAAANQLAFLKAQDERQNQQYLEEQQYTRQQAADTLARREPFRQIGLGALTQLRTPLGQRPQQPLGTLADAVR